MARTEVLERGIGSEKNQSDFRLEYGENAPDKALIDDVISYLGEYRFNIPKFSYELKFSNGKLRDPYAKDSMQNLTQRAIGKKILEGKSYSRELADKKGFINLDSQLMSAKENDTVVWASPPGPKEEGYGNYGFIFIGQVGKDNASGKTIQMTAMRVENPTIEQFNKAMHLLTGEKTDYKNAGEFLANPKVLNEHLQENYVDAILGMSFSFKPNEEEQRKFRHIVYGEMFPSIVDFVQFAKNPWKTKAEKIKGLYSLENFALKLKKEHDKALVSKENIIIDFKPILRLPDILGEYGHEPPKVAGSCPTSNSNKTSPASSNILSKGSFLNDLLGNQEWFHCPKCNFQADGPIGDTCPGCGLTKQAYAQESGVSCD